MSTVGWIIIQQSIYCHSGPLLMQVLIRTGRSGEGYWCGWEHFAHTHHFSQKPKLFGKYMNFFFLIKRIVIFRTKGEAGVFREAVMTLPPLIPGALHAHLDLHSGSTEHLSHSPGTLWSEDRGRTQGSFWCFGWEIGNIAE